MAKKHFLRLPGSPILFFSYKYLELPRVFKTAFPDCCSLRQGIQLFHIKAKIYERRMATVSKENRHASSVQKW